MSLRLSRVALREIAMPLREPLHASDLGADTRRVLLLTLTDADGLETWSECVTDVRPTLSADTIDTSWLALVEWIAPRVLGKGLSHPSTVDAILTRGIRGHRPAKAALEMGVWALWATREAVSLSRLLGGTQDAVPTGIVLGVQDSPRALVERATAGLSRGYRKVTMCVRPGADIEYLGAVREALGTNAPLALDGLGSYSLDHADHLSDLAAYRPLLLEQPLPPNDLRRHAELADRLGIPICLDESVADVAAAEDMLALRAARVLNVKAGRVGGLATAKAIHDLCQHHALPAFCGGDLETGIGRAYGVALASLPHFALPTDVSPSARFWHEDLVSPEWTMDASGMMPVPTTKPGLGVTVDADRIDNLTVRTKILTAP